MNPFAEILKVAERIEKIGEACDAPIYNLLMDQQEKLLAAASPEAIAFWKVAMEWGEWYVRNFKTKENWSDEESRLVRAYRALVARAKTEGE